MNPRLHHALHVCQLLYCGAPMLALTLLCLVSAKPPPDPRQDLLDSMVVELDRNFKTLKLKENAPPYFMSYQLKDYQQRELSARYGALFQDDTFRDRKLYVDVRVGDYAFDKLDRR